MYQFVERLNELYGLLQDEQSKEIFLARFALDVDISVRNIKRLVSAGGLEDRMRIEWNHPLREILRKLSQEHKKIILYGTAITGKLFAEILQLEHIEFHGFCGRNAGKFPHGLMGKPVLSPDELVTHGDEYHVVITVNDERFFTEISQFLRNCNYPEDHILPDWVNFTYIYTTVFSPYWNEKQYFEFPELYRRGTAFIDGGCYDCGTSYRFAEWCEGEYSSIIAFEPDPDNYTLCCRNAQDVPLPNFQVINAGLSSQEGTVIFDARNTSGSRVIPVDPDSNKAKFIIIGNEVSIRTVALDDIVGDRTVGFIKMDIEGSEFDALHGAKNTILRDKPLLAISVYHLSGDLVAIMDYLNQLLPEYRFYLRHYSSGKSETVLYASVDL